jgi:threonyl-tRNA synthetase
MKVLMFHCKEYKIEITGLSNRPKDISPEDIKDRFQKVENCLVIMITVEKGDDIKKTSENISREIINFSKETGHKNIVLLPFAHLSNNLADSKLTINFFDALTNLLKDKLNIVRTHFGSDKALLLDILGHKGNARFREF